jgi:transposase
MNQTNDLSLYSAESSLDSKSIAAFIDDFVQDITKETVIVIDNASVHISKYFENKRKEWEALGLKIFYLPTYSPHLNLIEYLWRFMKYEWIEFDVYDCWQNLVEYVEKIVKLFGVEYTIKFG